MEEGFTSFPAQEEKLTRARARRGSGKRGSEHFSDNAQVLERGMSSS